jgi:hypothetical protein
VRAHMTKISILRQLLLFVSHVDQDFKAGMLGVTLKNGLKLLLAQLYEPPNGSAALCQKTETFFAAGFEGCSKIFLRRVFDVHRSFLTSSAYTYAIDGPERGATKPLFLLTQFDVGVQVLPITRRPGGLIDRRRHFLGFEGGERRGAEGKTE